MAAHAQARLAAIWWRHQTPRKLIHAASAWTRYRLARHAGWLHPPHMPISLSVEPTTSCNLRCPECPSGLRAFTRPTGMLSEELFRSLMDEVHPWLSNLTLYFQGEPFLHPSFEDLVKEAHRQNVFTGTSTNAHYLTPERSRRVVESGLSRIIISIDGTTQDVYDQYRKGGKLDKVLEGTRNLLAARKDARSLSPFITFQFLVVRPNQHQISEVLKLGRRLGVDDVAFKSAQIYDHQHGSPLMPDEPQWSRYKRQSDGTYAIRNPWEDHCWRMWSGSVVTWDGRVIPCCFDKDAQVVLGSAGQRSFREIWNSPEYHRFRKTIFSARKSVDMCRNCTEGLQTAG